MSSARPPRDTAIQGPSQGPSRKHDAEKTRRDILTVATEEFASLGLAGARVDAIAERTQTTKRMIYYYFGSKDGLYQAVLEKAYADIRAVEQQIPTLETDPAAALRTLVELTFDYHDTHRDFVRLVSIENLDAGRHIKQISTMQDENRRVIQSLEQILAQGAAAGLFRPGLDAIDLHMLMSSFCFHRIANRYTFGTLFGRDPLDPQHRERQRAMLVETVMHYVAC